MKVFRWGTGLAVQLPGALVEALKLQEGDEIEIQVVGRRSFEIDTRPVSRALLERLRKFRGCLPADFRFDRPEANERG